MIYSSAPVQLWKYSCPITPWIREKSPSVAVSGDASTRRELKMLRDLFSMAPIEKSDTDTTLKSVRSYSRP